MGKIVVIGSANTDLVVKTDRMPSPGETILGGSFMMSGGGKGANQAVAASRLGGEVTFVARVGNDLFGERALAGYRAERLDVRHVTRDATVPSGVALICVDGAAENSIVVAPGANERLSPEDVDRAEAEIAAADFVVLQLEIPLPAVMRAAEVAERHGVRVILNPAPAAAIPDELLRRCYLLTPNRGECAMLTGMPVADAAGAERAADALLARGVRRVVFSRLDSSESCRTDEIRASLAFVEHNPPIIKQELAQARTPTPAELAKQAKEKAEKAAEQPETVIGVDVQ